MRKGPAVLNSSRLPAAGTMTTGATMAAGGEAAAADAATAGGGAMASTAGAATAGAIMQAMIGGAMAGAMSAVVTRAVSASEVAHAAHCIPDWVLLWRPPWRTLNTSAAAARRSFVRASSRSSEPSEGERGTLRRTLRRGCISCSYLAGSGVGRQCWLVSKQSRRCACGETTPNQGPPAAESLFRYP